MDPQFTPHETPLWQRLLKYGALVLAGIVALLIVLFIVLYVMSLSRGSLGFSSGQTMDVAPGMPMMDSVSSRAESVAVDGYGGMPMPPSAGYTTGLEDYERIDVRMQARTKEFDEACALLELLKADTQIDFRQLNTGLNYCRAEFFAPLSEEATVREQLAQVPGAEFTRSVQSVTRQREQIQSRQAILEEQLTSVERTLTQAETQYAALTEFARQSNDASALTEAIRDKLTMVEELTQRRIRLTDRLRSIAEQASDLEDRIDHVAFSISISRSYPVDSNETARAWERAWEQFNDTVTLILIGFSAYLSIFLLWVIQLAFYGLILIIVARLLWKFVRLVWRY